MIFCLLAVFSYSQKKRVDLSSEKIGPIECKYTLAIDMDKSDTLHYISISFMNKKYTSIKDPKAILFGEIKDLNRFVDDLKKMIPEMDVKENNLEFKREAYALNKYNFSKDLFLKESGGTEGYTSLSKGQVEKLIGWVEGLQFRGNE